MVIVSASESTQSAGPTEIDGNGSSSSGVKTTTSGTLVFFVNGKEVIDAAVNPEWTLLFYLRNKLKLTGTKLGCAEGGCGACTVMVSKYDRINRKIIHIAVNACLTPVCAMHGLAVTTTEGIGSTMTKLHPVQERIAKAHGSQCGFCTPGIVMSMYALLRAKPKPTMHNLEVAFQGNLCRCTGYRPIIEGYKTFTEEWEQAQLLSNASPKEPSVDYPCAMGDACCKRAFTSEPDEVFNTKEFQPYDPSQEPIFPPKLQISSKLDEEYLIVKGPEVTWYRPTTLEELLKLKLQFPQAKIIVGNTEVGVEVKFKHFVYPVLIQPSQVKEMHTVVKKKDSVIIGAAVTLTEMEDVLLDEIKTQPEHTTKIFNEIVKMLNWFAGRQIRNVGAPGGNIMTGSPISDLNPILMAAGTKLYLRSLQRGIRIVPMDHTFFTGYRRNVVAPDEILLSLEIPYTTQFQYFKAFKQAKRRDDDIAIVNLATNVVFHPGTSTVKDAHLAYGGMAPWTSLARKTREKMIDKEWNKELLETVFDSLVEEFPLPDDVPGGMVLYRRSLTLSLFFKSFIYITKCLQKNLSNVYEIPRDLLSASDEFGYKPPKSSQYFQVVPKDQDATDLVGRTIVHASAFKQSTGEALYLDDIPRMEDELYLALVLATRAHAKILKIDATKALALEGVVAFYSAKDIPEDRRWVGPVIHDDELFASDKVLTQGDRLGAIVAVDQATAQKAARMVEVEYEDIYPVVVSIEDAIEHKSYFPGYPRSFIIGDAKKAFEECDHVLERECRMGGQEHFYLETHAALVIPREADEIEMYSSTQHPSEMQKLTAHVLNVPMNRVNVKCKRMGGGFGGKESRGMLVALPCAWAAHKLRKPVRCMLDRDEDMLISGYRHPFLFKYKIGFDKNGILKALVVEMYLNAGCTFDLSDAVLERAMFHAENAYRLPVVEVHGYLCKTNLPSNTAFRGFGGPQGMFLPENYIREIADFLKIDVVTLAERNLYHAGDFTYYNQELTNCTIRRCWQECLAMFKLEERRAAVEKFNRENRYRKRGLSVIPTKFGIAYNILFLNQGGALIHVYLDGSVLISHGGTEMGQGLYTKTIQCACRVLKVPQSKVYIAETATDKVPNTSATAASTGSDLNSAAVVDGCQKIMERLKPIIDANPTGTWDDWVSTAYLQRISLSATGFYATPDIGYDKETNTGKAFNYFTYGVCGTEVEIDCLTGDHQVLCSHIVMDLGDSLNPAIDIGQIEGAFMQGYGLFVLEELIYSPTGTLYSRGPGAYKLPGFGDIPQEFNVSLLKGAPNPRAIYSSKAVGEPPLFLASSAFFAIKEAIIAARKEVNVHGEFRLDAPATSARIRMACVDELTQKVEKSQIAKRNGQPPKKPWNIPP